MLCKSAFLVTILTLLGVKFEKISLHKNTHVGYNIKN